MYSKPGQRKKSMRGRLWSLASMEGATASLDGPSTRIMKLPSATIISAGVGPNLANLKLNR